MNAPQAVVPTFDRTVDRTGLSAVLELLYIEERKGEKNGKPWQMYVAQCAVREEDGRTQVGELVLPKTMTPPPLGVYDAEFKIGVDASKKVSGYLVSLVPHRKASSVSPAASSLKP